MPAEHFGGKRMVGYTLGVSAVVTALCPLAAEMGAWAIILARVVIGILGVSYP